MQGVNEYLECPTEDIYQSEERDLLLFYMIAGAPGIHLCTNLPNDTIGYAVGEQQLEFDVELGVAAEGFSRKVWRFRVKARWQDSEILEVSAAAST